MTDVAPDVALTVQEAVLRYRSTGPRLDTFDLAWITSRATGLHVTEADVVRILDADRERVRLKQGGCA